jgi:hypothetical protein
MSNTTQTAKKRKNIEKDASTYWISHEARLLLRAIAKKRHLDPPQLLEIVSQELAAKYLTPEEQEAIRKQAEQIEETRRREAQGTAP